jgi:hypothetical protein
MTDDLKKRTREAAQEAQLAFWLKFRECFPESTGGDFPPDATNEFDTAIDKAVQVWLAWNMPEMDSALYTGDGGDSLTQYTRGAVWLIDEETRTYSFRPDGSKDIYRIHDDDWQVACTEDGCTNPDVQSTPCGSHCGEHLEEHMKECGVCESEFS